LVEEPWNIFAEADISPYVSLLSEVRKSLKSGKISLKDSEKSVYNFDLILKSLPEYGNQIKRIKDKLVSLHHFKNEEPIRKSRELREKIVSSKQELENCRNRIQDAKQEVLEKNRRLEIILNDSQTCVNNITGHKYILST
jgi:chromosome segregation ATPase